MNSPEELLRFEFEDNNCLEVEDNVPEISESYSHLVDTGGTHYDFRYFCNFRSLYRRHAAVLRRSMNDLS